MSKQPSQTFTCRVLVSIVVAGCFISVGCQTRPNWGPPGTIGMQRSKAMLHDPYPSNDLGPPIMGGRPPGYERPQSEATSLQTSPYARRSMRGGVVTPTYGF